MAANSRLWIALTASFIFCCVPMVLMGKRDGDPRDAARTPEV